MRDSCVVSRCRRLRTHRSRVFRHHLPSVHHLHLLRLLFFSSSCVCRCCCSRRALRFHSRRDAAGRAISAARSRQKRSPSVKVAIVPHVWAARAGICALAHSLATSRHLFTPPPSLPFSLAYACLPARLSSPARSQHHRRGTAITTMALTRYPQLITR